MVYKDAMDFYKNCEEFNDRNNKSKDSEESSVFDQIRALQDGGRQTEIGKFKGLSKVEELNLTKDVKLENVFFVTRETQDPEHENDSYECYEIYDSEGNLLATTDIDRNIHITPEFESRLIPEQIRQIEGKIMFRMPIKDRETGEIRNGIAVADADLKNNPEKKKEILYSDMPNKDENDGNVVNTVNPEEEEELSIPEIEEKRESDIQIISVVTDPTFYLTVRGSKFKTYLVKEDGEYKFIDGNGNDTPGMSKDNRVAKIDDGRTERTKENKETEALMHTGGMNNNQSIGILNGDVYIVNFSENETSAQMLQTNRIQTSEKDKAAAENASFGKTWSKDDVKTELDKRGRVDPNSVDDEILQDIADELNQAGCKHDPNALGEADKSWEVNDIFEKYEEKLLAKEKPTQQANGESEKERGERPTPAEIALGRRNNGGN